MSAEVTELPTTLVDDLARTEQQTLTDLTEGEGVPLAAFVTTPDGPEIVTLQAGRRSDAAAAVQLLERQPSVEAAALSVPVRKTGGSYEQWGNTAIRSEAARAQVPAAALADVVVAVLDSGVAPHEELVGALLPGRNFTDSPGGPTDSGDRDGHGTHVSGTVVADPGSHVEGVAAGAKVLPVKVLGDDGWGESAWVADGIIWAVDQGADVINMSLGGESSSLMTQAIGYARSKGVTVVASAGNDNTSAPQYPAADAGVIAVAATEEFGDRAWFSNYGTYVDVAAPGVDIASTYPAELGSYEWLSGTSMAAPHVAGVVALMEAVAPALTPDQVERALTGSATDLGAAGRDDLFGHGLVDAVRAVQSAKALAAPPAPVVRTPSAPRIGAQKALPGGVRVSWTAPTDNGGAAITSYRVTAFRGATPVKAVTVGGSTTTATLKGLKNGVAHRVAVTALNSAGSGPASAMVAATPRTKPSAPKIRSVTAQKKAVTVRWAKPASTGGAPVTGYVVRVYSAGRLVKAVNVGATKTGVTVAGLSKARSYTFRVLAKNAAGIGAASAPSKGVRPR
ncbi:S8 family serine peptidase [Blastococcus sp. SYSU DS0617]